MEANFNAANILSGEESGEDGDVAETMARGKSKGVAKKKKKPTGISSGLGQRKVFNNYMNEK